MLAIYLLSVVVSIIILCTAQPHVVLHPLPSQAVPPAPQGKTLPPQLGPEARPFSLFTLHFLADLVPCTLLPSQSRGKVQMNPSRFTEN